MSSPRTARAGECVTDESFSYSRAQARAGWEAQGNSLGRSLSLRLISRSKNSKSELGLRIPATQVKLLPSSIQFLGGLGAFKTLVNGRVTFVGGHV